MRLITAGLAILISHGLMVGLVKRVIDGDTIVVNLGDRTETVRYIGVDTPETVHPNKGVEPYGKTASEFNRSLVEGKWVRLTLDVEQRDRYGRLLAYVYTDSLFVNAELLRRGYAQLMTVPPNVLHVDEFVALQKHARETGEGLWGTEITIPPVPQTDNERSREAVEPGGGDDILVYITRTGTKYHRAGCHHLKHSRIPIRLSGARKRYEPCSVCIPSDMGRVRARSNTSGNEWLK
ncbi:thermonuclease family protein [Gemmatimonadota bacterium]